MNKRECADKFKARPIVYDYGSPHVFFSDLLAHLKATTKFSIRQRVEGVTGCSPALVSHVLSGKRRLTRDQLPAFAKIFKLNNFEFEFIDKNLTTVLWDNHQTQSIENSKNVNRIPKNHILSSWANVYIKDLVNLRDFALDTKTLHGLLNGMINPAQIEKSIVFLLKEGFWRRTLNNKILPEESALVSTNEIPNEKIRVFHKQALKIALRGLEIFSSDHRKASTVLISINKAKIPELRSLVDSFQNQLLKFITDNPEGNDNLMQVTIHLTPVGGRND